jgi:phage tail-like protein
MADLELYKITPIGEKENDSSQSLKKFTQAIDVVVNDVKARIELLLESWNESVEADEMLKNLAGTLGIEYDETLPRDDREALVQNAVGIYKLRGTIWAIRFLIRKLTGCRPHITSEGSVKSVMMTNIISSRIFNQYSLEDAQSVGTVNDLNDYVYCDDFVNGFVKIRLEAFSGSNGDLNIIEYLIKEYLGPGPYEIIPENYLPIEQELGLF